MYPSKEAREIAILLRISRELDICGDVTVTVDNPSELIAWASALTAPAVTAWQAKDSGCPYVQVGAEHRRAPVRGHVTAVLTCEQHPSFWAELPLHDLRPGHSRALTVQDLADAWEAMPITAPTNETRPDRMSTDGQ